MPKWCLPPRGHPDSVLLLVLAVDSARLRCDHDVTPPISMMDWTPPPPLACSLTPIHAPTPQMPHKFNAARRHKFDKVQYRVINWAEYNESLRQRGDLTIWVSEEAQSVWSAPCRTSRGGQRRYSDLAIETCLMLRTAYHLGLRQTQGLMGSIGTLMGLDIRVPDYSTLSRRANGVSIAQVMRQAGSVPIHLVVDSTGHHSGMRKIADLDLLLHRQSFIGCPWLRRRPCFKHPRRPKGGSKLIRITIQFKMCSGRSGTVA